MYVYEFNYKVFPLLKKVFSVKMNAIIMIELNMIDDKDDKKISRENNSLSKEYFQYKT